MFSYAPGQNWWLARFVGGHWEGGYLGVMQWAEPSPGESFGGYRHICVRCVGYPDR